MQVNFKTNSFTHGNSIESQNNAFNRAEKIDTFRNVVSKTNTDNGV